MKKNDEELEKIIEDLKIPILYRDEFTEFKNSLKFLKISNENLYCEMFELLTFQEK